MKGVEQERRAFLAALVGVMMSGCQNPIRATRPDDASFKVRVIDGCEYLEYDAGATDERVYSLTHKGNCKNPVHKCGG